MKISLRAVSNGLLLIFLGVVFLLLNYGVLNWGFWRSFLDFWPVILIVIGAGLIFNRRIPISLAFLILGLVMLGISLVRPQPPSNFIWPFGRAEFSQNQRAIDYSIPGGVKTGYLKINALGANINLSDTGSGFAQGEVTTYNGEPSVKFDTVGDTAKLNLDTSLGRRFFNNHGENISLKLTNQIPLDIDISTGATKGTFDFSRLKLAKLTLSTGAADLTMNFGNTGMHSKADISSGASTITIVAPKGVGLRIQNSGVSSIEFSNQANFIKQGSYYTSNDFSSAASSVDINLSAGASKVNIEQE